eukprot:749165-Rhodomonas_salina.2
MGECHEAAVYRRRGGRVFPKQRDQIAQGSAIDRRRSGHRRNVRLSSSLSSFRRCQTQVGLLKKCYGFATLCTRCTSAISGPD